MHSVTPRPARRFIRLAPVASLTFLLMLAAALARAQCTISGPSTICSGGSATLCGPGDPTVDSYEWTGPNGYFNWTQCITVSTPGTYSLTYYDNRAGVALGPCDHVLTVATPPTATITGATSACAGSTIDLCGPAGDYSYAWSGPGGFADTSMCIHATVAGSYSLTLTDRASGCVGAPASQTISFSPAPTASISGASSACAGSAIDLCGPAGNYSYAWSGPGGFTATSMCAHASVAGQYSLVVTDLSTGCASASVSQTVSFTQAPTASISGATSACAGSGIDLCGPSGNLSYAWSGPGGFTAATMCAHVTAAGTYSLVVTDNGTGCASASVSQTVSFTSAPVASISGPTNGCTGTTLNLCGPSGNLSYAWSGPNGFADTSMCVAVGASGLYSLIVTDRGTGCVSMAYSQSELFTTCQIQTVACPRPAWFWSAQCRQDHPTLSTDQTAGLAACVDQHSQLFAWTDDAAGFCATLSSHSTLRSHAKRQFAAVLANICAGSMGLQSASGASIGLDPATPLATGTVGSWVAATDQQMIALETRSMHEKGIKSAYRDIIRAAWKINHADGMGPTCATSTDGVLAGARDNSGDDGGDSAQRSAVESLDAQLADDGEVDLVIDRVAPNPTTDRATIAYELIASSDQPVSIGIFDIAGRRLRQLVSAPQAPGLHVIDWDGRDGSGQPVPGGVYFVRGHVGPQPVQTRVTMVR